MHSAGSICCIVLGLQTSALLTPPRPPRAALRCDAKSKKKDKASFKPPPPELRHAMDVCTRTRPKGGGKGTPKNKNSGGLGMSTGKKMTFD